MAAFHSQYQTPLALRKSRELHDRLVIIDNQDCWIVGGSIKDAGKNPTYLVPLPPKIGAKKIEIYEGIWSEAKSVENPPA